MCCLNKGLCPCSEASMIDRKVDAKISQLLAERDLSRTWIHVDLDAFFASCEELDDPSLVIFKGIFSSFSTLSRHHLCPSVLVA